jgi:hypothetical protein
VIADGRVELTEVEASNRLMDFVISKGNITNGVEQGINSALDAKGLQPTEITLQNGSLTIMTTGGRR